MSQVNLALEALQRARGEQAARLAAIDDAIAAIARIDTPATPETAAPAARAPAKAKAKSRAKTGTKPAKRGRRGDPARDDKIRALANGGDDPKGVMSQVGLSPGAYAYHYRRLGISLPSDRARKAPKAKTTPTRKASPAPKPSPVPPPPPSAPHVDESEEIARFIAAKGVTRAVDFGPHQPIVDVARSMARTVLKSSNGKGWLVDGSPEPITTATLYERINAERKRREQPPIAVPSGAP